MAEGLKLGAINYGLFMAPRLLEYEPVTTALPPRRPAWLLAVSAGWVVACLLLVLPGLVEPDRRANGLSAALAVRLAVVACVVGMLWWSVIRHSVAATRWFAILQAWALLIVAFCGLVMVSRQAWRGLHWPVLLVLILWVLLAVVLLLLSLVAFRQWLILLESRATPR